MQNTKVSETQAIEFDVRGMHCAGCVSAVEAALLKTPGIQRAAVNLATERATVWVLPAVGDVSQRVAQAVRAAGYEATPHATERGGRSRLEERRASLRKHRRRLALAAVFGLPVVAVHMGPMLLESWLPPAVHSVLHSIISIWAQVILSFATIVLAAGDIFLAAWRASLHRQVNMDTLVTLGAGVAYAAGIYAAISGTHELLLFETATMIVLFVGVGKLLEAQARGAASAALESLASRLPTKAFRITAGGDLDAVDIGAVGVGDRLRIPPHSIVPVDGEIVAGTASVDEAALTGESVPLTRGVGARLMSGVRLVDGSVDLIATATGADSTAAKLARLVAEAQGIKPPWQRLADRVAAWFVPVVLGLAILTFIGWWWAGAAPTAALIRAIAVLVVACPCAMGLAVPTAVMVGTSAAAKRGILVRDPAALEAAAAVRLVLLDKTGTLTQGIPRLVSIAADDETAALKLAAAVAQTSTHPYSIALVQAARERGLAPPQATELETIPGAGISAFILGQRVLLGSQAWLREKGVLLSPLAHSNRPEGSGTSFLARNGLFVARFALADMLHPEAVTAIKGLHALGLETRIISGDLEEVVRRVAAELGIERWEAGLSPQAKLELVRSEAAASTVAFVGDGINDAPALAAAQVGIAIGTGADVAREAADICLVGNSPLRIVDAIRLARRSAAIMRQNLGWAAGYNLLMLPAAALTHLPAEFAAAAMMFSSFSVVLNSLRLRG